MDTLSYASAMQDFKMARRRATLEDIMAHLAGKSAYLLSFDEVRRKVRATNAGPRVLREIPLDAIVGSVGRYADFTRSFLPRQDSDQERWARVKAAMLDLYGLPPIEVYQIGDAFFVKDGNHRVSVARELGASHIEAYVVEVQTKVPFSADTRPDDLILKAEYADFLEQTGLKELRPEADLSVTVPGLYQPLKEHIDVHRHMMAVEQQKGIAYSEAVVEWYDSFYLPVVAVIRERGILRDFPGRTETDLYLWTLEHREALEDELGWEIGLGSAAADLAVQFGAKPRRITTWFSSHLRDSVTPDASATEPSPEPRSNRRSDCLFSDVLVAVDGQESGWHALEGAQAITQPEKTRLHGLYVVPGQAKKDRLEAQGVQNEFERRCREAGFSGRLAVDAGQVSQLIWERSRLVDLVVLSLSHPYAPRPLARLGSGLHAIIQRCATPVLLVPGPVPRVERLMLAYDGSKKANEALFVAAYLASRRDIPLAVLTVIEDDRTTTNTLTQAGDYLEKLGVQSTLLQENGPVAETVLIAAEEHDADLILMGGYGFSRMIEVAFGSTLERLLRSSHRPILACG
jgi:nucleotide-binding universal stress UspA family protein